MAGFQEQHATLQKRKNMSQFVAIKSHLVHSNPWQGKPRINFQVEIEPDAWEPTGPDDDKSARLQLSGAGFSICGLQIHIEAWAVGLDGDGMQVGLGYSDDLVNLSAIYDNAFSTTVINDREYVIVGMPAGA